MPLRPLDALSSILITMGSEPAEDEDYASAEDSDFAPEPAQERDSSPESDGEAHASKESQGGTSKRQPDDAAEDAGFENSGDEAVIEKGRKRRRKTTGRGGEEREDGGQGGLIKTRSQRAQESVTRSNIRPRCDTLSCLRCEQES